MPLKPRKAKSGKKAIAKPTAQPKVKRRAVTGITFRECTDADDEFLLHVTRETMKDVFEKSVGVKLTDAMILSQIKNSGSSVLIERDGKPIGYTSYTLFKPGHMYWGALVLAKSAQGQGIGLHVCDLVFEHFRKLGCEVIHGHVQVENVKAVEYWKRRGFEIVGGPTAGSYEIEKKLK